MLAGTLTTHCPLTTGVNTRVKPRYGKLSSLSDRTQEAVDRALAKQTEYSIEYRAIWSDGNVGWILAKGRGFYNQNDEPVRMVGTVQDITARKHSEQELKDTQAALSQSKQLLRKVLDSLIIYVGILTPDGVLIDVNCTALEAANLKPKDVLNKPREKYWTKSDSLP